MKVENHTCNLCAACRLCSLAMLNPGGFQRSTAKDRFPSNIRITPPAPTFDDKASRELKQRRERVAQSVGPQSFMILFSTEPRVYTNDVDYPYRQENNLYYLTQPEAEGRDTRSAAGQHKDCARFSSCRAAIQPRRRGPATCTAPKKQTSFRAFERSGRRASLIRSSRRCAIASLTGPSLKTSFMSDLPLTCR
jgi:hypothetical protein